MNQNGEAIELLEANPTEIEWKLLSINSNPKAIELLKANPEKINKLLEVLPNNNYNKNIEKNIYNMSIKDIYKNTLQTAIDIINDVSELYSNEFYSKNYNREHYIKKFRQ